MKRALHLPARAGSDLHTSQMAKAWVARGHRVEYFAWEAEGCEDAGFPVRSLTVDPQRDGGDALDLGPLQRRLCRYMGAGLDEIGAVRRTLNAGDFDVCIAAGLEELFYLPGLEAARIWYPADECVFAALSQVRLNNGVRNNYQLAVEAAACWGMERFWRQAPDASWVVSDTDRRWLQAVTGRPAEVIANGVDVEFFRPVETPLDPRRLVFWGRLDYGPNEQGLEWFFAKVWDRLRERRPDAQLAVIGFNPSEKVRRLVDRPGVELLANVPDLRAAVCAAPIALYPFVSGGGIRNKLLEGAAMARALLVSPRAVDGLPIVQEAPWVLCRRPEDWVREIGRLFDDPPAAAELGRAARRWVQAGYTWDRAAELGEESMLQAIERRPARTA